MRMRVLKYLWLSVFGFIIAMCVIWLLYCWPIDSMSFSARQYKLPKDEHFVKTIFNHPKRFRISKYESVYYLLPYKTYDHFEVHYHIKVASEDLWDSLETSGTIVYNSDEYYKMRESVIESRLSQDHNSSDETYQKIYRIITRHDRIVREFGITPGTQFFMVSLPTPEDIVRPVSEEFLVIKNDDGVDDLFLYPYPIEFWKRGSVKNLSEAPVIVKE